MQNTALESARPLVAMQPGHHAGLPPPSVGDGWLLALGSAALWQLDPALAELGAFACAVACASSQELARESVLQMRAHAASLRRRVSPLSARAMARVVRNAERASGQVLDKKAKLRDLQSSWDDLLHCLHLTRR